VDGAEERLLAREARVDRADGDTGATADLGEREAFVALLLEDAHPRFEHALERSTAALLDGRMKRVRRVSPHETES